jgi:hypothetical protein
MCVRVHGPSSIVEPNQHHLHATCRYGKEYFRLKVHPSRHIASTASQVSTAVVVAGRRRSKWLLRRLVPRARGSLKSSHPIMRNLFEYVSHGLALRTALTVGVQLATPASKPRRSTTSRYHQVGCTSVSNKLQSAVWYIRSCRKSA